MLPSQRKKVDMKTMTEEEKKLFMLYGKLPTHKNVLTKVQKDRKYFDSGDYALSKAGVAPQSNVGTAIPSPDTIPHASPPTQSGSTPVSTPGIPTPSGGIPIASSSSSERQPSSLSTDIHGEINADAASTSPTSSYPISSEMTSSPLNPATSAHTNASDVDQATAEADGKPKSIDLADIVPGIQKSDLPNSSTPMSGEEADTEMA